MTPEIKATADNPSSQILLYVRRVSSWSDVLVELSYFPSSWVFRGQRDSTWEIRCNLDRKRGTVDPAFAETLVLEEFRRRAHLYLPNGREPETPLEWLALIQHHGGPTRLIDFTLSPQMAAFFALEEHVDNESPEAACAVWGLDGFACRSRAVKRLQAIGPELQWLKEYHDIQPFVEKRIGSPTPERLVAPIRPSRHNSRLALQQGTFMFLGDPGTDLFGNLGADAEGEPPLKVVRLEFPRRLRREALRSLARWGINRETLFPGLDGLAGSMAHLLLQGPTALDALVEQMLRPYGWPATEEGPAKD